MCVFYSPSVTLTQATGSLLPDFFKFIHSFYDHHKSFLKNLLQKLGTLNLAEQSFVFHAGVTGAPTSFCLNIQNSSSASVCKSIMSLIESLTVKRHDDKRWVQ